MQKRTKTVVIAAGGTGGHLFPAQAVGSHLQQQKGKDSVIFIGKGLSANSCFYKENFHHKEVEASSFSVKKILKTLFLLGKGTWQSFILLGKLRPRVVIGFGSYHTFPVLMAAVLRRIPFVLFESNTVPGKVNRLFSPWARFSAMQFSAARKGLRGPSYEVAMPLWCQDSVATKEEAYAYFSLDPTKLVLLIFGGSQGAVFLNKQVLEALSLIQEKARQWQIIHLIGKESSLSEITKRYETLGIQATVKVFEEKMSLAWQIAEGALCRSGAATFAELVAFAVPSLLIPYPRASEQHQLHNARFMEEKVKGGICVEEKELSIELLRFHLERWMTEGTQEMKGALQQFRERQSKTTLVDLIEEHIYI